MSKDPCVPTANLRCYYGVCKEYSHLLPLTLKDYLWNSTRLHWQEYNSDRAPDYTERFKLDYSHDPGCSKPYRYFKMYKGYMRFCWSCQDMGFLFLDPQDWVCSKCAQPTGSEDEWLESWGFQVVDDI